MAERKVRTAMIASHPLDPDFVLEATSGEATIPAGIAARVETVWAKETRGDAGLFDGPIFSVVDHRPDRLLVQRFGYKHLVASRKDPRVEAATGLKPLGVTALLSGPDGLVLGRRGGGVRFDAGLWEAAPAGGLDDPDWRGVLMGEMLEELGLPADAIVSVTPIALVEDRGSRVWDILCRAETPLASGAIERFHRGRGSDEYSRIAVVPASDLELFLSAHEAELAPALRPMLACGGFLAPA